jgi:hypothetical protein
MNNIRENFVLIKHISSPSKIGGKEGKTKSFQTARAYPKAPEMPAQFSLG